MGSWVLWLAVIGPGAGWPSGLPTVVARDALAGASEIRIYRLKHAHAANLARILQKAFAVRRGRGTGFAFTADVRTNSLIVIAPIDRADEVEGLIRKLDMGTRPARVKVVGTRTQPTRGRPPPAPATRATLRRGPFVRVYPVAELLVGDPGKTPTEQAIDKQVRDLCASIAPVVRNVDPKAPAGPTVTGVRHLRALIINGSQRVHRKAAEILAELRRHRRVQVALRLYGVTGLRRGAARYMRSAAQLATDGAPIALRLVDEPEARRVLRGLRQAGGRVKTTTWYWVPDGSAVVAHLGPARRYVSAIEAEVVGGRLQVRPVRRTLHEGLSVHGVPVCRDDRGAIKLQLAVQQTHMQKMHTSAHASGAYRLAAPQAKTIRFTTTLTIPPGRVAVLSWPGPEGLATVVVVEARAYENVPTTMPSGLLAAPATSRRR